MAARHPTCNFMQEVERERVECVRRLREAEEDEEEGETSSSPGQGPRLS